MPKLFSRMKKGISPLIAAVLLIAFTMTIAAILATWAQTFGEEQLGEAGEEGRMAIDCPRIRLNIERASYNDDDGKIDNVILWNRAPEELSDIRFVVYDDDGPVIFDDVYYRDNDDEVFIDSGSFARLEAETEDSIDEESIERLEVHVQPQQCPDVQPIDRCIGVDNEGNFLC